MSSLSKLFISDGKFVITQEGVILNTISYAQLLQHFDVQICSTCTYKYNFCTKNHKLNYEKYLSNADEILVSLFITPIEVVT